jgi:amino acid transporter
MIFAIAVLIVVAYVAYRAAPKEKDDAHEHVHAAGQIGLLAAIALFGVDYFTSFYYGTGELMSALHPYGLQDYGYIAAAVIAIANFAFGALYMYSLGIFNEGGGSYTASMRYLKPTLSLVVAVTLIEDYVLTIVVSALSGGDQLLSLFPKFYENWWLHFLIGALLACFTWFVTIRGRGESSTVTFTMLGMFGGLTVLMAIGLFMAHFRGVSPVPPTTPLPATFGQALLHLLTASMKGMVALSGLEAMSNGIQFVKDEDFSLVKWGKKHMPKWEKLWHFYSGKSGIGRMVQTSFLFYGGLTTFFLTAFAIRFDVFDGTLGRSLVGNLSYIGFNQIPGGEILFWAYQILAVFMLAAASMTALQDAQATEWRDVAIGEIPEVIIYRDKRGTFTRSVTITFIVAVLIMLLVKGRTTVAAPFYGVGVFLPIMVMGMAVRQHFLQNYTGRTRIIGAWGAGFAAALSATVFVGQIVGKWEEGGWIRLITMTTLVTSAHLLLLSPLGHRSPEQIRRIVRDKARIQGAMGSIVEWQSVKMQQYRFSILTMISQFWALFGVIRPVRYDPPPPAGDYDHALHIDHPEAPSFLDQYIGKPEPRMGGAPKQTEPVPPGLE